MAPSLKLNMFLSYVTVILCPNLEPDLNALKFRNATRCSKRNIVCESRQHHPSCKKLLVDGEHITNPVDIANHFSSFYDALASSNTTSPNLLPVASRIEQLEDISLGCDDQVIDTEICIEEIEGALKSLKPNRSGGPDG